MTKPSLLFIHRSVGENLVNDGKLYSLVREAGAPFVMCDFNQNTNRLRQEGAAPRPCNWQFPGNDTTPVDYAALFNQRRLERSDPTLQDILLYDIIMVKSCYPNTRLTSDAMLTAHQRAYEQIVQFFQEQKSKRLVILTSPPLIPLLTLPPFARRARRLANWLATTDFGSSISVFDFFNELAVPEGQPQANTLRRIHRRQFLFDSHPNHAASVAIAPKLVAFLQHVAEQ